MLIIKDHLEIISCEEWGAAPPTHPIEIRNQTAPGFIFHHTAGQNYPENVLPATQRRMGIILAKVIQHSHMAGNGWVDTGNHFLNTVDGILIEGRHESIKSVLAGKVNIGAHAADGKLWFNDWFSVENEGNFSTHEMNPKQMNSLVALIAWVSIKQKFDSSKVEGHRATGIATACPGEWLFSQTDNIRKAVHAKKLQFLELLGG